MLFNDLLTKHNIDLNGVLVFRHTPWEREFRKVLPWLAIEKPHFFNAYQQTQDKKVEAAMLKARYVASFIGSDKRKGGEDIGVFVGLYKVGDNRKLTWDEFWKIEAYREMKKYGMHGFQKEDRDFCLWFNLEITDFYKHWQGRLMIEWPRPPVQWARWADKNEFPIHAILQDSALHEAMPHWKDCILPWARLSLLPIHWRRTLSEWRGIYYISDVSDGKGYVGSAYGNDNIDGRWQVYAITGHGNNVHLRDRSPENLRFSILQLVAQDMEMDEVIALEANWKNRLNTRWPSGLNDN
jgi:hypothetical protein